MSTTASPFTDFQHWDYMQGFSIEENILLKRFEHLRKLNIMSGYSLKCSTRDISDNSWTKWLKFPGRMLKFKRRNKWETDCILEPAYDVHRSVLENEIVIESDYVCDSCKKLKEQKKSAVPGCLDCYELNYEASTLVGKILENKGFIPHYYYSGSKSIHMHVYLDFEALLKLDLFLQNQILSSFKHRSSFVKKFIEWLRNRMIDCWDLKIRDFDKDLIKSSHLIRSELSFNKVGYKTFLGHSYKDLSFIPIICNPKNGFKPKLGNIILSTPNHLQEVLEDFLNDQALGKKLAKVRRRESSLFNWMSSPKQDEVRSCVKMLLVDDFKDVGDGYQRAMFILANELNNVYGPEKASQMLHNWNERMGFPVRSQEIDYRINSKEYTLPCKYVHDFLDTLGITTKSLKCYNHKT